MKLLSSKYTKLLLSTVSVLAFANTLNAAEEVVVYSSRKEQLIKPLFDAYQKKTGTTVKYITDKAGPLIARLEAEGKNTPADLFITVDAGNLWQATQKGLLAPVKSETLSHNVPKHLADPEGHWYGLSIRARTIVYSTDRVKPEELTTYEDLGTEKWQNRVCLRTSKKVYNQSLVAMMIARHGENDAEKVVKSWIGNLAAKPFSNDTKVMEAIVAGRCDVGIVNSYYFGRLQKKDPSIKLALYWPNQTDHGVHVNISGAGVTKHAKNAKGAQQLLEYLSSDEAQSLFASLNLEFPANSEVNRDPLVAKWGTFKQDTINVAKAGQLQAAAVKLMDRAGYQ